MPPTITLKIIDSKSAADSYSVILSVKKPDGEVQKKIDIPKKSFEITPDPVSTMLTNTGISKDFQQIGKQLYDLIHQSEVGTEWDGFKAENPEFRIIFDIEPPEIAALPWELACDGPQRLATNPNQTFVRRYQPGGSIRKLPELELRPLRILIVVGAAQTDTSVLAADEIRQIKYDVRNNVNLVHRIIDLEVIYNPTLTDLGNTYTAFKPHIFHFIGHGGLDLLGEPSLIITSYDNLEKPTTTFWDAASIFDNFQNWGKHFEEWEKVPRFVFINACRSNALPAADTLKMAWSVGQSFRELNVPAVLTMQADIKGTIAGIFAGALYKSLAELEPLDKALVSARAVVKDRVVGGFGTRDWATPVLTVAVPPEEVFSLNPPVPSAELQNIVRCQAFEKIKYFSARVSERREMIQSFYPLPPTLADRNLIVIKGKAGTGKSSLAKLGLQICALLNQDVRYVEVGNKTFLDILLHISCGNPELATTSLVYQPLMPTAFEDFNWNLKRRLAKQEPGDRNGAVVSIENKNGTFYIDGEPIGLLSDAAPSLIEETFKSFIEALKQAAAHKPLVIALDHFSDIREREITDYLIPLLIQPVADGEKNDGAAEKNASPVKFIMVVDDNEFDKFNIQTKIGNLHKVPLEPFNRKKFSAFVEEILYYAKPEKTLAQLQNIIEGLMNIIWENEQEFLPERAEQFKPKS